MVVFVCPHQTNGIAYMPFSVSDRFTFFFKKGTGHQVDISLKIVFLTSDVGVELAIVKASIGDWC